MHLKETGINERLNHDALKSVICFGNTSFEENLSIPSNERIQVEENRAQKRASMLSICVNKTMRNLTPIYSLNLGKHTIETEESSWQRQILIIGLVKKDKNVTETEALYNGLINKYHSRNLEFKISDYSNVDTIAKKLDMKRMYN